MDHPYNGELTSKEQSLGYQLKYVANPRGGYFLHSKKVEAVVFPLGQSDLIIKLNDPAGRVVYSHQRYGTCRAELGLPSLPAEWRPVGTMTPEDPVEAIRLARSGEDVAVDIDPVAPPADEQFL